MTAPRRLTAHAIERYRKRHDRNATLADIQTVLNRARIQQKTILGGEADCYAVDGDVIFPLARDDDGDLIALTCLRRRRIPKADLRAMRELARDELHAA